MRKALRWLLRPVILWSLLLIYIVMFFWIMPRAAAKIKPYSHEILVLDMELNYNTQQVQLLFETLGERGREVYRSVELTEDFFYPLSYGLLLSLGIVYFFRKILPNIPQMSMLGIFPLIAMGFDYVENFMIVYLLSSYPQISDQSVSVASSATTLKWGFIIISLLLIFIALIMHLFKRYVFRRG